MKIFIKAIIFLLFPFFSFGNPSDSLLTILTQSPKDISTEEKTYLNIEIGKAFFNENDFEKAVYYFESAKNTSQTLKNEIEEIVLFWLGKSYRANSDYENAIESFLSFLKITPKNNFDKRTEACNELSKIYTNISNFDKSFEFGLKGLTIKETQKDTLGIIKCLYELGYNFFYQKNYELALEYYFQTKALSEKINNKRYIFNSFAAIGGTYSRQWKTKKSIKFNLKALAMAKEMDYKIGIAYAAQNIGANYYAVEAYDSAAIFFKQSLDIKNDLKDDWGKVASLQFLGNSLVKKKQFKEGLTYLNSALDLALKIKANSRILECYTMLSEAYNLAKDGQNAYKYLLQYSNLKDSLLNESTQQKLAKAKTEYEVLKRENELEKKEREIENIYEKGLVLGICFLILIIWLVYKRLQIQAKNNGILRNKNIQINEQLQKLEISNRELEQFAFIASHDLKEPLRNIGSYASLLNRRYKDTLDGDGKEFLSFITKGVSKMYNLLDNVLAFSKIDKIEEKIESVKIEEIVNSIKLDIEHEIKAKKAIIKTQNLPTVEVGKHQIKQVFQNLILNGIDYSNGNRPTIYINCHQENNQYVFSVMDNGIGFDMVYKDKIFEIFQRLNKQDGNNRTGVGLSLCKKIISKYGGDIWVESELGKGSTFYFSLPKN